MTAFVQSRPEIARGPAGVGLKDPISGRPLRFEQPWSLSDGSSRWPVVEGIPFLRVGRDRLRAEALESLDSGDEPAARLLLLADQDDFARIPPPDAATLEEMVTSVDSGRGTLREAMAALNFGPVANYFAHRWSAPTYLSGLALLAMRPAGLPVVEIACGIGHYLRDLERSGVECGGIDVVFSKLWLARRFLVGPDVPLICGDVAAGWGLETSDRPSVAFCHDAFYFLPEKPGVLAAMRSLSTDAGMILIGHAHNRWHDHNGVSGEPKTPHEYADLLPGCTLFDDAELGRSAWSNQVAQPRSADNLVRSEAVALVWPPVSGERAENPSSKVLRLRLNPMLQDDAGVLRPRWPSPRFEAEYAAESNYLIGEPTPSAATRNRAAEGISDAEIERLARRRILLDLPERW